MNYDIIGDIHGCFKELITLLEKLGYSTETDIPVHQHGRRLAFVGDAMDRGPNSLKTLEFLFNLQDSDSLIYSPGNHCNKFYRYAKKHKVQEQHGLETTIAELNTLSTDAREHFLKRYICFYEALPLYHTLDDGKLIIAHAGIRQDMIGAEPSEKIRVFTQYGDITGEKLPNGRPLRRDWAKMYKGDAFIIYGHTPVKEARFVNNTVNIDTGCVFGGDLTALRYPEMKIVSTPSAQAFVEEKFTTYS